MFKCFSFKKKQKESLSPLIINKLDRIIELLEHQQKEISGKNIHFEHVQIDHLENIIFRLDSIEIDELSGKLMIGNNITTTDDLAKQLMNKMDKEKAKEEAQSESTSSPMTKITKTEKGYRFRNKI